MVSLHNFTRSRRLNKSQLRDALAEPRNGNFSVNLPDDGDDLDSEIAREFNELVSMNQRLALELERMVRWSARRAKSKFGR